MTPFWSVFGDLFGIKIYFVPRRLAQNWEPIPVGNVDSPRTPHSLAAGLEHKGFDIVQHAFAPQGGGRIEDAMRRVTAAPRSLRLASIESSPDLANSCDIQRQWGPSRFIWRLEKANISCLQTGENSTDDSPFFFLE